MARKAKKYSPEIKMQAVEDYKAGKGSLRILCKKYGIKDHKTLREWISCYRRPMMPICLIWEQQKRCDNTC